MSQARPLAAITGRQRSRRVDYDEIADLYDAQPYRARTADPELLAFAGQRKSVDLAVLEIGCGTGNQLIANRVALPHAWVRRPRPVVRHAATGSPQGAGARLAARGWRAAAVSRRQL